jgi:hypothetical protein
MAEFVTKSPWSRRLAVVAALAVVAGLLLALPSGALDGFESADANLDNDGSTDWNDFDDYWNKQTIGATNITTSSNAAPDTVVSGFDKLTWVQDRSGNPDDIYGGGVKQDQNCPATKEGSLGGGESKFDIDRLYLTHTQQGGDDYLFLAWVRVPQNSTTASSHIAYEFNRGSTLCPLSGPDNQKGGPKLIARESGDRLLVYDFEGGQATSTSPTLKLLTWLKAGDGLSGSCEVASSRPCWGGARSLNVAGVSDASVNTVDIGSVDDDIAGESLGAVRFGEAGINLSAIPDLDVCDFAGHVTGVARSSGNSGTAQMKDKVGPAVFDLPGCFNETGITTRISLDDHATINGFDADFPGDGSGTLTFSLYGPDDTDCNGTPVYETTIEDIDGAGPWSTAEGDNTDSSYVVPHTAAAQGVYSWVVEYSGDSTNLPSSSDCGEETADVQYGLGT